MNLKQEIIQANNAYRTGSPKISDVEYDILLTKLETEMGFIAFESFKETLTEQNGDIKHNYIIGSLNKIRYQENDELAKWLDKNPTVWLFASEKIDGCSFVASYRGGSLISCASRGDGYTGTNWFSKAVHILPNNISYKKDLDIRGEFCLTNDSHTLLGMKNRRNGVVGLMGTDTIDPIKLAHVKPLVYEILNSKSGIKDQFETLRQLGFVTPFGAEIYVDNDIEDNLKRFFDKVKSNTEYDKDGLVISSNYYVNENEFYPKTKVAFKVNSEGVKATVIGIEWNTSKNGAVKPVVLITPTDIDGATIRRVSGYNAKYIVENKIEIGVTVSIIRSGDVIPKIVQVFN
jgi:DNA ligase (NAD+)